MVLLGLPPSLCLTHPPYNDTTTLLTPCSLTLLSHSPLCSLTLLSSLVCSPYSPIPLLLHAFYQLSITSVHNCSPAIRLRCASLPIYCTPFLVPQFPFATSLPSSFLLDHIPSFAPPFFSNHPTLVDEVMFPVPFLQLLKERHLITMHATLSMDFIREDLVSRELMHG